MNIFTVPVPYFIKFLLIHLVAKNLQSSPQLWFEHQAINIKTGWRENFLVRKSSAKSGNFSLIVVYCEVLLTLSQGLKVTNHAMLLLVSVLFCIASLIQYFVYKHQLKVKCGLNS